MSENETADRPHNLSTYNNHGCRCDVCREAKRAYQRKVRKRNAQKVPPAHVHGTMNGYQNYGCRCPDCTEAQRLGYYRRSKRG